jgi:hypothetical protein
VNKSVLTEIETMLVEQWENESNKKIAITTTRDSNAYMLLHQTDFDPFHRTSFRYVIDFVFVPEESRHKSIAYDMLTSSQAYKLNLCAFTNSDESDALFCKAGFYKEGEFGCPILVRDNVEENLGTMMQIHEIKTRIELNGRMVKPISFDYQRLRYVCVIDGEGIRLKPTNLSKLR